MRKLKLLLAACALFGVSAAWAQTDVTSTYLTNADLSTTDGWTVSGSLAGTLATDGEVNTIEFYHTWGSNAGTAIGNSKDFTLSQTVTLPAGNYRIAVNALYREGNGNGTNTKAYIFAGTKQQYVHAVTAAEQANLGSASGAYSASKRKDDRGRAAYAFSIGDFSNAFDFDLETEQEITLGFSGYIDTYCSWVILGPVKLYKYSLDDYLSDYDAKYTEADGIKNSPMNADIKSALTAAMVDRSTFNLVSEVTAAIQTLTTAINNANASIAVYSNINTAITNYAAAAADLDEAGAAVYDASAIQTKYDNGTYETLAEAESELSTALIAATKAQTSEGSNWTGLIKNPSFESNFDGWSNVGMAIQGNASFTLKNGSKYVEKWEPNGTFTLSQTITGMPVGVYRLSAAALARSATSAKIYAAGVETPITIKDAADTYSVDFACDDNADVTIGFEGKGNGTGDSWLCVDNFTLTLVSAGLPDVTAAEGKMNATVADAQTSAISSYNANRTVEGYNAAMAAIAAAEASIAAYAPMTAVIAKLDAAIAAATSATASTDDYDVVKTAYTNGTIADADIHTNIVNAYEAIIPIIKSQTAAGADFTLAIQNQSFEYGDLTGWTVDASSDTGVRDASSATYAATGSDGNYLFNTWWKGNPITQAVAGLPNGQYTLTASVASDGATIYLIANGEHNEGTETGGTYPSSDTFQEATITFLVKDGNATIGAVGGADGTAGEHKDYVAEGYWWYKADNFRLAKNRDLTPEEEAVVPTAIALYNGENEVTEPIALNATTNTVTLTVVYTPNDATEGVEWSTSDANVATVVDGVVTGVAPGTATITATSTLDASVSATATVTVTYPESTVLTSFYANEGATRKVTTITGENLIKNGSFEYPNAYYGWTYGTGSTTAITSEKFDIVTEGAADGNQYLKAKTNEGGAAAGSLNTSWPIEPNKTYVFGYKVKSSAASTGNQYLGTSLNTTKGQENSNAKLANPAYNANEWTDVQYVFESGDNTWLVFNARWLANALSFDNFYLAEAKYTLKGNVDYATAAIPTANIGTGAFQYSQDAIDAANALVQGTATVEDVENAYTALTTINEPADGQLFNVSLAYGQWSYKKDNKTYYLDNEAMTYLAGDRTDHGGYNIKYQAVANQNLAQAFTFTKVEGNNYKMSQIDADGIVRYICTGVPYNGNTGQIRTTTEADKALIVTIIPTTTDGKWNLKNTEANNFIGAQDEGVYTVNSHIDFKIVETTKPSIDINTTVAGWGTVILPFAVASLPTGVKAYSCAAVEGTTLTLAEVNALEANKPYIIEGAWNETVSGDAQGTALTYKEGLLTGIYAATEVPVGSYILQNQNNVVAFYNVKEGNQPTLGANHAYLTVGNSAREALYFGGDATGIMAIDALTSGNATIFNAAGAQIPALQKGMNIVRKADGKSYKVIVK